MSIEKLIAENTAAIEKNTEALLSVIAGASASTDKTPADDAPSKPTAAEKKAAAAKKAAEKKAPADDEADAFTTLRKDLAGWLGEFAKEEDKESPDGIHPEVTARREAIQTTLGKLKVKVLADIKGDDAKIEKLSNWLHDKAIPVDKGFGVGRLAPDPEDLEDDDGLDDL